MQMRLVILCLLLETSPPHARDEVSRLMTKQPNPLLGAMKLKGGGRQIWSAGKKNNMKE